MTVANGRFGGCRLPGEEAAALLTAGAPVPAAPPPNRQTRGTGHP
jgi:hypothetical protein